MKKPYNLQTLRSLHGTEKLRYIWDYYKLPLAVLGVCLYVVIYMVYGRLTYKETVLYAALVNVNAGADLTAALDIDFLDFMGLDTAKNKLELYTGLYLTDDEQNAYFEYTYASRMKVLAAIDGEQLDVVLMNQESFDAFSQNGYLCDLKALLSQKEPDLYARIEPDFAANIMILEDNASDMVFDSSLSYQAVTEEHFYGVDLSHTGLIRQAGFEGAVYLGIVANSPRMDTAAAYLEYLFSHE